MDLLVDRLARALAGPTRSESRRFVIGRGLGFAVGLARFGLVPNSASLAQETSLDDQSRRRPDRYSRKEGVTDWRVKRSGSTYSIEFSHKKQKLSGRLQISFSGGDGYSANLSRSRERVQLAVNQKRGTFAGVDAQGQSTVGRVNERAIRWDFDPRSERVLKGSIGDFRLIMATVADLTRKRGSRSAATAQQGAQKAPCTKCNKENLQSAGATSTVSAIAWYNATFAVNEDCARKTGCICCEFLTGIHPAGCDCGCISETGFECYCVRAGLTCVRGTEPGTCRPVVGPSEKIT